MAHVNVNNDTVLAIFDGSEYSNRKKRILKFLELKGCKTVVTREKVRSDEEDDWNQNNLKAVNYIYSTISNKQLEYVGDLDSAYAIIKKFDQMYLKESTALQIVCRNNLENINLKNFSEVTTFFDEFEKAVNELKAAGAKVTESEKLRYMLKALPQSYSYIGDLMDVLKEEDRTVEFLKNKIKLESMERSTQGRNRIETKSEEDYYKSNAFYTETEEGRGRGGGGRGRGGVGRGEGGGAGQGGSKRGGGIGGNKTFIFY